MHTLWVLVLMRAWRRRSLGLGWTSWGRHEPHHGAGTRIRLDGGLELGRADVDAGVERTAAPWKRIGKDRRAPRTLRTLRTPLCHNDCGGVF
jgi:hypothetical protein